MKKESRLLASWPIYVFRGVPIVLRGKDTKGKTLRGFWANDPESKEMDWNKVNKARQLIKSGFYDDPEIYEAILDHYVIPRLCELRNCPVGKGDKYRDTVAEVLAHSLHKIVDGVLIRKEFPCSDGRGPFEMLSDKAPK